MIYQTIKKRIRNQESRIKHSQPGVTLLLAILLLSAILAISFSLATILLFQVRTSEDFSKTEGALYAADGIGEQALFNTERQVSSPTYVSSFGNSAFLSGQPVLSSTNTPTFQDVVAANSSFANTTNKYDFCGDTATTTGCGYGQLTLTYLPTGNTDPLEVYLCQFNPNTEYSQVPCSATSTEAYWITTSGSGALPDVPSDPHGTSMSAGATLNWSDACGTDSCLDPALQQQLILYTSSINPIYVSISTRDGSGNPSGLPLSGKTSVSINAINSTTGRRIQVLVPNSNGTGLSDNINYALAANGGVATSSSQFSANYPTSAINDGDVLGNNWSNPGYGDGWNDAVGPPSWAEVDFSAVHSINEIDVYTLADCYGTCASISNSTTANLYGIINFLVQYDNGGTWQTVSGGSVTGNTLAWRQFTFTPVVTGKIRVTITAAQDTWSRIVELQAY